MNNEFISNKRKSSKLDHPMLILRQNEYMKNNWRKFFTCNDVSKIENRLKECQKPRSSLLMKMNMTCTDILLSYEIIIE
jgi:hypothetical protein